MSRPKNRGSRVTKTGQVTSASEHGGRVTASGGYEPDVIAPLYKRKPGVFAFIMLACIAMVMSMMAGIFTVL